MRDKRMRRITIRAGTAMHPRAKGARAERARKEHNVLGLASTAPGGVPCWSFLRGKSEGRTEYWYVLGEDVRDPQDMPDEGGYVP